MSYCLVGAFCFEIFELKKKYSFLKFFVVQKFLLTKYSNEIINFSSKQKQTSKYVCTLIMVVLYDLFHYFIFNGYLISSIVFSNCILFPY
jgi:hypothetical protein